MKVIQTCDPLKYKKMLDISGSLNKFYCDLHGYDYLPFVGMKRCKSGIHAAYNRVYLLKELLDGGYRGWVLYLDADAYVHDLSFDAYKFLSERSHYGFVAAEASPQLTQIWAINNGIFFINLGVESGQYIASLYYDQVQKKVPMEYWEDPEAGWAPSDYDDQNILYGILAHELILPHVCKVSSEVLNYSSSSIRQTLRTFGSVEERIHALRNNCRASFNYFMTKQTPGFLSAYSNLLG